MLYILMRWVALHLCRAAESHQRRSALHCRCRRPALVTRRHTSPHTSTHSWLVLTPLTLFSPPCSPHSVSPFISFISGSSLYQWLSRVVHFFDFSARAFLASYFPHFHVAFFKPCLISLCFLFFFFSLLIICAQLWHKGGWIKMSHVAVTFHTPHSCWHVKVTNQCRIMEMTGHLVRVGDVYWSRGWGEWNETLVERRMIRPPKILINSLCVNQRVNARKTKQIFFTLTKIHRRVRVTDRNWTGMNHKGIFFFAKPLLELIKQIKTLSHPLQLLYKRGQRSVWRLNSSDQ